MLEDEGCFVDNLTLETFKDRKPIRALLAIMAAEVHYRIKRYLSANIDSLSPQIHRLLNVIPALREYLEALAEWEVIKIRTHPVFQQVSDAVMSYITRAGIQT